MFHIGQKVICVPSPDAIKGLARAPDTKAGHVYTVREIDTRMIEYGGPLALRFEELFGPVVRLPEILGGGTWEIASDALNYRPYVATDISIFTEMLNNVPKHDRVTIYEDDEITVTRPR